MSVKLFGNSRKPRLEKNEKRKTEKKKEKRTVLDKIISVFLVLVTLEAMYCTAVFSNLPIISDLRTMYIDTAMSTMRHHWLATYFIPPAVVNAVTDQIAKAREAQIGVNTGWNQGAKGGNNKNEAPTAEPDLTEAEMDSMAPDEREFYNVFPEIDPKSMELYVKANPSVIKDGWDHISINEAGLDDEGTDIMTRQGDRVLALDVKNQIVLLRVTGNGYRGVLALCKDPARVSIQPGPGIGSYGSYAGDIAEAHNGILAITASGFIDNGGTGNGGTLAGYAMCNGTEYGSAHMNWGYKRAELHKDDLLYITDAQAAVSEDTRDAVEFMPALIIDGEVIVDEDCGWNGINPRAVIGQNSDYAMMMLVIEGRQTYSIGTGVVECAEILHRYGGMQAMNLDGGSSAIMWYDGEYVTRCGNRALPKGRPMPNAFVYEAAE